MKSCSVQLQTHLSGNPTTLAWLWLVARADGSVFGFTSLDVEITYNAGDGNGDVTYEASRGLSSTSNQFKSDLTVDNSDAMVFLESGSITEQDIRGGKYDGATFTARLVNWTDLSMGDLLVRTGYFGNIKMKNGVATVECRGLASKLSTTVGGQFGPMCRATFGSGMNGIDMESSWFCMVDVTAYRQDGSVSSSPDNFHIVPNSGLLEVGSSDPTAPAAAGWFNDGIIAFTSGVLDGEIFEIKSWDGTTLTMCMPLPAQPSASDTFYIESGCDHTIGLNGCQKYDNVGNFQGEPVIPGMDALFATPDSSYQG